MLYGNVWQTSSDLLTENPNLRAQELTDAIFAKHPGAKINKGSFLVAFYTGSKKREISSLHRAK